MPKMKTHSGTKKRFKITGSGKVMETGGGESHWKFETPRGRLVVQAKDSAPTWVPPDWHYVEQARKRGLGIVRLNRGDAIPASDGSEITVEGTDVVKRYPDGRVAPIGDAKEGHEIVAGGNIVKQHSVAVLGSASKEQVVIVVEIGAQPRRPELRVARVRILRTYARVSADDGCAAHEAKD